MWKGKLLNPNRLRTTTIVESIDPRNAFESDFGRIIFSAALRRMHDKTQVFPLTLDDNIHSRLTHSMEVMAIGYSLGLRLCEDKRFISKIGKEASLLIREIPIILKNTCLVHDIGNPPFGHFGEAAIQNYFVELFKSNKIGLSSLEKEDFTKFDGNAQGFRVLTKLQNLEDAYGLNLTYATLAAYAKYPNPKEIKKERLSTKKRGVFQSEKEYLSIVMKACGLEKDGDFFRHPLTFLMEAADTICYLVMDVEDGFNKHLYTYGYVESCFGGINGLANAFKKVKGKYKSDMARMVGLRIELISILVELAINNFMTNYEAICKGSYNKELVFDDENDLAKSLADFCLENIFAKREIQFLELTGDSVLSGLLDYYVTFLFHENKAYRKRGWGLISGSIKRTVLLENNLGWQNFDLKNLDKLSDYYKLRTIVDFISGMTDQYALNHYRKLNGQKIN